MPYSFLLIATARSLSPIVSTCPIAINTSNYLSIRRANADVVSPLSRRALAALATLAGLLATSKPAVGEFR